MTKPYEIYDLLQDYAAATAAVEEIIFGLVWTYCEADAVGLAMSPGLPSRTLAWSGTLRGRPLHQLTPWLREFDVHQATVGLAAVNAGINRLRLPAPAAVLQRQPQPEADNNLEVFEHFLPQIRDRKSVCVGRYPGLDRFIAAHRLDMAVLERQPGQGDLPDSASEYLLPPAEWVFLTASSLANKTFPRLAELSRNAITVLMGPSTPWLPEFRHFGIDYLAGVEVADPALLRQTVAEGGGVRIFDGGVRYRIAPLTAAAAQDWTRQLIARTVQEKDGLQQAMEHWYGAGNRQRFPGHPRLEQANVRLSRLDTCFKTLWDGAS